MREQPAFRQHLADQAFTPTFPDRRAFAAFIVSETATWRLVAQAANVKADRAWASQPSGKA